MEDNNKDNARRERFLKIAEQRTNKILDDFRLLGNCSNKANYQYTEDEINKIFDLLEQELKLTRFKFKDKNNNKFRL